MINNDFKDEGTRGWRGKSKGDVVTFHDFFSKRPKVISVPE